MNRGRLLRNTAMTGVFSVAGWVAIVFIFLIFLFTFKETVGVLNAHTMKAFFLANPPVWQPTSDIPKLSLIPIILGTLKATVVGMLFACPVGVCAALFSSEFAPPRLREVIKPVIELLAGIPSVVMGFFALIVLATWLQDLFGFTYRLNAVNAGLALGFALVPIVYTISEDGLSAVPRAYREASFALGATRFQTAWKVVLPAAAPAVFASFVLAFGRAVGETMILLMAGGNAAITSLSLLDPLRTLSATIAAEMGEVVVGSEHYAALFFMGTLLFVITFVSNSMGQWVIARMQQRLQGATR
ncbi:MAG TPA: phosphate ABC transporter permease subunit PstC [Thermoanaerobaculia bacterium]|nr:phosphate ABC transporter permease subunit PstC [Thermoanaerobaculia bacterium]